MSCPSYYSPNSSSRSLICRPPLGSIFDSIQHSYSILNLPTGSASPWRAGENLRGNGRRANDPCLDPVSSQHLEKAPTVRRKSSKRQSFIIEQPPPSDTSLSSGKIKRGFTSKIRSTNYDKSSTTRQPARIERGPTRVTRQPTLPGWDEGQLNFSEPPRLSLGSQIVLVPLNTKGQL